MQETNDQVHCPKCNSTSLTTNKKGFSGKNAVAGAVLTGGIGLLAGTIGSNKVLITCLNCGKQFKPGEGKSGSGKTYTEQQKAERVERVSDRFKELKNDVDYQKRAKTNLLTFGILFIIGSVICFMSGLNVTGGILLAIGILILYARSKSAAAAKKKI